MTSWKAASIASKVFGVILFIGIPSAIVYTLYQHKGEKFVEKPIVMRVVPLTPTGMGVQKDHPKWDNATCNSVGEKQLRIGMRREMVEAAWGRPCTVIWRVDGRADGASTHFLSTKEEEWIMDPGPPPDYPPGGQPRRVIFRNFMNNSEPDNNAKVIFFQDSITFRIPH